MPAKLVEESPEWEFSGGFFFVEWNDERWAYTPHAFFQMFAGMGVVAREYRFQSAEIIPFPERVEAIAEH